MIQSKLQILCMIITAHIAYIHYKDQGGEPKKAHTKLYEHIINTSMLYYIFDIATVYTVNHLDSVSPVLNRALHLGYLISIDTMLFLIFRYIIKLCCVEFRSRMIDMATTIPYFASVLVAILTIHKLYYVEGKYTNYSMGIPAYACYAVGMAYFLYTILLFIHRRNYIEQKKVKLFRLYSIVVVGGMIVQLLVPESLISSAVVLIMVLGLYAQVENNEVLNAERMYENTVHAFADIVESRDGSTGEHVKRTTIYVRIIAEEMRKDKRYAAIITKDYINNLVLAAPLHDIGKVSVPDAILQKPGKLTFEEFEEMKLHTVNGQEIINRSFAVLEDKMLTQMMKEVALYHHEKVDGTGYPTNLKGDEIPLCARIMAVADVFDAVSQNRCYRDAMSLDESFAIIEEGMGKHFDADVAACFLAARGKVEKAYAGQA